MAFRGTEGIGWHRLARLSRYVHLFRHILWASVVECSLGRLRMDAYLLVAGSSLLVPLLLPSQYTPSLPAILLYLCIVLFLVFPRR